MAKASFEGAGSTWERCRWTLPVAAPCPLLLNPSTAIRYVVPWVAAKLIWLWRLVFWVMSSLAAIWVRPFTAVPVYAASTVSKPDPVVSMVAWPVTGAVQRYQTEAPPELPAWLGSPASLVAPTLESALRATDVPLSVCAAAKALLGGAA